jgi:hypothetical protein
MAQNILSLANCASPDSVFNVGVPLCDLSKKKIKGVIFADKGVSFSGSEIASSSAFIEAVKTKTTAARGGRVYPIWDINNFEDNTGDPATGGVGNLTTATIVVSDAVPSFSFGYNGSEARMKRMSAMAAASLDIFFVDEQFAVFGTEDSEGVFGGYSVLQAYHDTSKFIVADAVNQYRFRVTLGSIAEYRDQSHYVLTNVGILAAKGLVNVTLSKASNSTNVYKIDAIADGGTNFAELHGTAVAAMAWTAKNLQTSAALTVTSIAYDSTLKCFTVTIDATAYGQLASGDKFQLSGPSAATLSAGSVKPFEMLSLTITK